MSIRTLCTEQLTETLSLQVVDVRDPKRPGDAHTIYEVACSVCDDVDQYDQRSAAETYGPQHRCPIRVRREHCTAVMHGAPAAWDAIVFTFADGTTLRAHHNRARNRWDIDGGDGWAHTAELVDAGLCTALDHGPSTLGHITFTLTAAAVAEAEG